MHGSPARRHLGISRGLSKLGQQCRRPRLERLAMRRRSRRNRFQMGQAGGGLVLEFQPFHRDVVLDLIEVDLGDTAALIEDEALLPQAAPSEQPGRRHAPEARDRPDARLAHITGGVDTVGGQGRDLRAPDADDACARDGKAIKMLLELPLTALLNLRFMSTGECTTHFRICRRKPGK